MVKPTTVSFNWDILFVMILLISTLVGTVIKEQIGKVAKSFMIISLILVSVIYFILIYKTYKNNIRVEYTLYFGINNIIRLYIMKSNFILFLLLSIILGFICGLYTKDNITKTNDNI